MDQKKILIVDDDADLVLANRLVLESAGYAVDEASNGAECLEKLSVSLPDLVLMDVMMTNPLDGYLTTQQIFDDESMRGVPIVMISSIATSQYAASFPTNQFLNILEFVSKPIDPETLKKKVKGWLRG